MRSELIRGMKRSQVELISVVLFLFLVQLQPKRNILSVQVQSGFIESSERVYWAKPLRTLFQPSFNLPLKEERLNIKLSIGIQPIWLKWFV